MKIDNASVCAELKRLEQALNKVDLQYAPNDTGIRYNTNGDFENPKPVSFIVFCGLDHDSFQPTDFEGDVQENARLICTRIAAVVDNKIPALLKTAGFSPKYLENVAVFLAAYSDEESIKNLVKSGVVGTLALAQIDNYEAGEVLKELSSLGPSTAAEMKLAIDNYLTLRSVFLLPSSDDVTDFTKMRNGGLDVIYSFTARSLALAKLNKRISISAPEVVGQVPGEQPTQAPAK